MDYLKISSDTPTRRDNFKVSLWGREIDSVISVTDMDDISAESGVTSVNIRMPFVFGDKDKPIDTKELLNNPSITLTWWEQHISGADTQVTASVTECLKIARYNHRKAELKRNKELPLTDDQLLDGFIAVNWCRVNI